MTSRAPFWDNDAFFREAVDSAYEGVWVIDAQDRNAYVNPRMATLLGYSVAEMLGQHVRSFVAEDEWPRLQQHLERHREGNSAQYEYRLKRKDGEIVHELLACNSLFDKDGAYQGALWMVTEIGERVRLECELAACNSQLAVAERLARLGSWAWHVDGDRVTWSDQLYRIYGLEPQSETITYAGYLGKLHPEDRERCAQLVAAALKEKRGFRYDERILWPDGSVRHLASRGEVVLDADGEVERVVGICMDVTERRHGEEQLELLSHYDPVTGLINRYVLMERAETALDHAVRHHEKLGFLLIDLDRFKHVNDSLGHPVGDRVLEIIGGRIRRAVRSDDTVSRVGGDEFVVMLDDIRDTRDAAATAQKLLQVVAQPLQVDHHAFSLTASIGVVCAPQDGGDVATLLKHADAAMYRAKQRGRSTFQFYSGDIGAGAVEVLQLTSSLEQAAARGELSLVYQPRVRLHDAGLAGVEALLRWQHPQLGAIPPARFIPLAEETGQIVEIGRWVLRTACEQAMAWRGTGLPAFTLSVNLSTRQLIDSDFVDGVRVVLRETGFPPGDLEFEITEGTTVHDYPVVNAMLAALAELGVAISVDDFGTGYSSLQQLYRLSIDRVKIDRSFVEALPGDDSAHAIVAAIMAMARALRLATTAEGVETEAQLRCLRELGCEEVQGYLLARPLTPEGLVEAIDRAAGGLRLRTAVPEMLPQSPLA